MENSDFDTYLTIMGVMYNSNVKTYYARTKNERYIFSNLQKAGYVNRLIKTKYCYELSSKGIKESSGIFKSNESFLINSKPIKANNFENIIFDSILELITPIRPMVKVPDLWNYLQRKYNNRLQREHFEKIVFEMHKKGMITLQSGFSINETKGGIRTLQGKNYYYIIIDN